MDPCYVDWADYLDALWTSDPQGVTTVLDVCCGTGLLAAELVPRGYTVVGVDASAQMLARARERMGDAMRLERALLPDLPELQGSSSIDAIVSTMDGLNYLTPGDLRLSLVALADRVRPAGWLVFDLHTDAMLEYISMHPLIEGDDDGRQYAIRSEVEGRTCSSTIEFTGAEPFVERHVQHFHADGDVRAALDDAGFDLRAVTDEYTPTSASASTLRATWVARRR